MSSKPRTNRRRKKGEGLRKVNVKELEKGGGAGNKEKANITRNGGHAQPE